jgi:hypothetical protein
VVVDDDPDPRMLNSNSNNLGMRITMNGRSDTDEDGVVPPEVPDRFDSCENVVSFVSKRSSRVSF